MPGVAADIKEKHELSKWEMAYVHCSGIFLVRSDRGYHFVASSLTEQVESKSLSVVREDETPPCSLSAVCEKGWCLACQ